MKAARQVFRQAALDRLASPEQLDELIPVVDARGWIAALGIGVLTAAIIAWGFLGSIPTEVLARGILVTQGGRVVSALSPTSGVVASLTVKPGDAVWRGQPVATIHQPEAELRLANAGQVEAERAVTLETRGASLQREGQALEANATQRKGAQEQIIEQANERIGRLRRQLEIREQMRPRNLALEERVEQARADLARAQQDVSDARARMVEIDTELLHSRLEAERELAGLRAGLADAKRATAEAGAALTAARDVVAPATGKVTELAVSEGQMVTANGTVLKRRNRGAAVASRGLCADGAWQAGLRRNGGAHRAVHSQNAGMGGAQRPCRLDLGFPSHAAGHGGGPREPPTGAKFRRRQCAVRGAHRPPARQYAQRICLEFRHWSDA